METSNTNKVTPEAGHEKPRLVVPSSARSGGQTSSVLQSSGNGSSQKGSSHSSNGEPMVLLRTEMREATVVGEELLAKSVGEKIIQQYPLLRTAGKLLAEKIAKTPCISSHDIDIILDVGSGEYPGLGVSLATALTEHSGVSLRSDVKVICHSWNDTELSSMLKEARVVKILIVTAARTSEISKKMQSFIDLVQKGTSNSSDVVFKICSLVCVNDNDNTTEKHIDGVVVSE